MRNTKSLLAWLFVLALTGLLAACGSSPGSDPAAAVPTGPPAQGIAVDPYIVGAIFQEVAADGTLLQRQSTASDASGRFSFPQPLTPGSIIELKPASKGMHNGVPYQGMIRRRVDDSAATTWVVSPLTTFTATGLSEEQVLSLFARAGLSGLTAADLTADPLAAINLGGSIDASTRLAPLQAAMAANAYMQAANDYVLTPADLNNTAHLAVFDAMVTAATEFLSIATFNALANDSAVIASGTPLSADDLIRTAATLCQQVSDQVRRSPTLPMATAIDNTLASAPIYARQHYEARTGTATAIPPAPVPDSTPAPTPTPAPDGAALYTASCAICHKFASLDATGFAPDLNNTGGQIVAKLQAGHNGIALSAAGANALGNWITSNSTVVTPVPEPTPSPTPDPTPAPAPDGAALYAASCDGCHKFGSLDTAGFAPDLNNLGSLIPAKLQAGHNGIALSAAETAALGSWIVTNSIAVTPVPAPVPVPNPTTPPDGASLYAIECAGCHGNLASTNKPGRTAAQTQNAITANLGGMGGIVLTTAELQAIADALATVTPAPAPGPDYSDCTACHRQPPNGSAAPNRAGAHAVHSALPGVGTTCAVCHTGAAHNDWVDLAFPAAYNAKSGTAADNPNGTATCTNISCHGGKTTPDWATGSINVNSQCTSCHAYGTTQYNSYASGKHSRSDHSRQACTVCHNTTSLASSHFSRLNTTALEGPAAATIGGGTTRVSSYNAGTKTCTTSCHGSERW